MSTIFKHFSRRTGLSRAATLLLAFAVVCGAAESKFYAKLKSGGNPKLMIVGNSTSQEVSVIPNKCNTTNYVQWPGQLKSALQKEGAMQFTGSTCAGRHSGNFLDGSDGFAKSLAWAKQEKPDAIIIEFAPGADCVSRFNITVAQSRDTHVKILDALLLANPEIEIFLWTGARSWGGKWADRLSRIASDETQPDYAKMYVDLAAARGVNVYAVDTYSKFLNIYNTQGEATYKTYMNDENHTNAKAAGEIIVPEFLSVMKGGNGPAPALSLVSPGANASFSVGEAMTVKWDYNPDSTSDDIEISFSPNGGKNWLAVTSAVNKDAKQYQWTIPEQLSGASVVSADARLRINEYNNEGNLRTVSIVIKPFGSVPVVIDNLDSKVQYVGNWTVSTSTNGSAFYGSNYRHDGNEAQGTKRAVFTPGLAALGNYIVSMQWASNTNRAMNVPVVIRAIDGDKSLTVNQQQDGGKWNVLGTFALAPDATVTVKNDGADGFVVADAVQFEYVGPASTGAVSGLTARHRASLASNRRVVSALANVRIPVGVAGYRVYSVGGRLLHRFDRVGDATTLRTMPSPVNGRGMTTCVIEYVLR